MTDCNLTQLLNGKWWCSACDPDKQRTLPGNFRRNCRATMEPPRPFGLGDRVSQALTFVGITEGRVSAWLGCPCGCAERRERLNQLGRWAARVLSGKTDQAKEHLEDMIGSEP